MLGWVYHTAFMDTYRLWTLLVVDNTLQDAKSKFKKINKQYECRGIGIMYGTS